MIEFQSEKSSNYEIPCAPSLTKSLKGFLCLFSDSVDGETIALIGHLIVKLEAMIADANEESESKKVANPYCDSECDLPQVDESKTIDMV